MKNTNETRGLIEAYAERYTAGIDDSIIVRVERTAQNGYCVRQIRTDNPTGIYDTICSGMGLNEAYYFVLGMYRGLLTKKTAERLKLEMLGN